MSGVDRRAVTWFDNTTNGGSFSYDNNGNMTSRRLKSVDPTYAQTWDYDNRLQSVTANEQTTTFTYDGNGALVKKVAGGVTTVYIGSYYEKQGGTVVKYYLFGGQRVAMNKGGVLYYLAGDHPSAALRTGLDTTNVVLCGQPAGCSGVAFGGKVAESRHYPYGAERWPLDGAFPTDYRFTGQRFEESLGLYLMGARWYDPYLARWLSADTIVPDPATPQSLNRYLCLLAADRPSWQHGADGQQQRRRRLRTPAGTSRCRCRCRTPARGRGAPGSPRSPGRCTMPRAQSQSVSATNQRWRR